MFPVTLVPSILCAGGLVVAYTFNKVQLSENQNSCDIRLVSEIFSSSLIFGSFSINLNISRI
jgi:hypothetical protein